jgi:hypothetical protein
MTDKHTWIFLDHLLRGCTLFGRQTARRRPAPCTGIFKQSMGARNRVGIGLSFRPARLYSLVELIPWNRFLGSLNVYKFGLWKGFQNIGMKELIPRGRRSSYFWFPRNLYSHMDKQFRTCDTEFVKSRGMTGRSQTLPGWLGGRVKTT